jgi:hypothetical protein
MRARTTTVLGLILLLAAVPAEAAPSVPPPPPALRVFVGTTSVGSPLHRCLAISRATAQGRAGAASGSHGFLAAVLPLFGPDLLGGFAGAPLVTAYVRASVLGSLGPMAIGSGESLAWSPYLVPPGRDMLELMMARHIVPALVPGDGGVQAADLKITGGDSPAGTPLFVTDLNLRGRNAPGDDTRIEPPALAVVGLGLVCLAPASRRSRSAPRLQPMRRLRFHRR